MISRDKKKIVVYGVDKSNDPNLQWVEAHNLKQYFYDDWLGSFSPNLIHDRCLQDHGFSYGS